MVASGGTRRASRSAFSWYVTETGRCSRQLPEKSVYPAMKISAPWGAWIPYLISRWKRPGPPRVCGRIFARRGMGDRALPPPLIPGNVHPSLRQPVRWVDGKKRLTSQPSLPAVRGSIQFGTVVPQCPDCDRLSLQSGRTCRQSAPRIRARTGGGSLFDHLVGDGSLCRRESERMVRTIAIVL
jgi:hypothetical protein